MKLRTNVKAAGILAGNHNEAQGVGLAVKTRVKAGVITGNHNEGLISAQNAGVAVKTRVKAGAILASNHNESLVAA